MDNRKHIEQSKQQTTEILASVWSPTDTAVWRFCLHFGGPGETLASEDWLPAGLEAARDGNLEGLRQLVAGGWCANDVVDRHGSRETEIQSKIKQRLRCRMPNATK